MTEREALKLALEGAANYIDALGGDSRKYRQALAEQPAQQTIHCKHRRENNGVCPHHNLQCGWPNCNQPEQPAQPEPVIDKSAAIRIATALGWEPKRKPLTEEDVWDAYMQISAEFDCNVIDLVEFARAIEAAHGIKE